MALSTARSGLVGKTLSLVAFTAASLLSIRASSPSSSVGIAVLHAAPWAPGDAAREGAGEFEVLLRVAQLQRAHRVAGLISVGDRHGMRACGGERALSRVALTGIPVVKLARGGEVASTPADLFLDGRSLNEEQAKTTLERCLERFGAPPAAKDPEHPTKQELAKIRAHLSRFRQAFELASAPRLAAHRS
jgi:hypothetical protein